MMNTLALLTAGIGAMLDVLNLFWGFRSARGTSRQSGILFLPALFYVVGVLLAPAESFLGDHKATACAALVLLHLLCYFVVPAIFDRCFGPEKRKQS